MTGRRFAIGLVALAIGLVAAAPAAATFSSPRLVSAIPSEQATRAGTPDLSGDGRFMAFQGTIDEARTGVFRLEVDSGDIARVAVGPPGDTGAAAASAVNPSISADGRYVSFSTRAALDPANDPAPNSRDVYVADMSTVPPSYELASAFDEATQSLGGTSTVASRVALSGNGRRVVFVHDLQVYLRDLDAGSTTLVSVRRDPASGAIEPGVEVPGGAVPAAENLAPLQVAALSADGTTVAWVGAHLPEQVPMLADEAETVAAEDSYNEPLWRRVADGPLAPTRRIVGGGDPLAPGCPGSAGTLAEPACRGPFPDLNGDENDIASGWLRRSAINGVPQLSADGRVVAVIGSPTSAANAFLVDMAPGLTRVQAVRQLTAQVPVRPAEEDGVVNRDPYIPLNGHVFDLGLSADGRRIALATARQRFPLAPPTLVGSPPARLGLVELYLIDLETESLQRLTSGFGGVSEPSLGPDGEFVDQGAGASAPSLGGSGDRLIGFASTASNLVPGDGNEASDAFIVEDESQPLGPGAVILPSAKKPRKPKPVRKLRLRASSLPNGKVRLVAVAPTAGRLRASAEAPLELGSRPRWLDGERARARANRPVKLLLALPARLRHLAQTPGGLYATVRIVFRTGEGKRLSTRRQVRFLIHPSRRGRDR